MELKNSPGVYKITCQQNGRFYIGSSLKCRQRWSEHKSDLRKNRHGSVRLQKSYDKYGIDDFVFEVLEYFPSEISILELRTHEQRYLDLYQSYDKKNRL